MAGLASGVALAGSLSCLQKTGLATTLAVMVLLFVAGDVTPSVTIFFVAKWRLPVMDGDAMFARVGDKLLADPSVLQGALANDAVKATLLKDFETVTALMRDARVIMTCDGGAETETGASSIRTCKSAAGEAIQECASCVAVYKRKVQQTLRMYFQAHPQDLAKLMSDQWMLDTFFADGPYTKTGSITLSNINAFSQAMDAGAYGIGVTILLLSITWPYVKIFLQVCAWGMPMRDGVREGILLTLEQAGKLCIVEVLILTLAMIGFVADLDVNFPGTEVDVYINARTAVAAPCGPFLPSPANCHAATCT